MKPFPVTTSLASLGSSRRHRAVVLGGANGSEIVGCASAEAAREVIRTARRYGVPIVCDVRLVEELMAPPATPIRRTNR